MALPKSRSEKNKELCLFYDYALNNTAVQAASSVGKKRTELSIFHSITESYPFMHCQNAVQKKVTLISVYT